LYAPFIWRYRRMAAIVICFYILGATVWLGYEGGEIMGLALSLVLIFRIGNMARVVRNRMHEQYMRRVIKRTVLWLLIIQSVIFWFLIIPITSTQDLAIRLFVLIQLGVAASLLLITVKNVIKLRFNMPTVFLSDQELPTVTVAIPARDETNDLEECLRSLIANDYPKLEIIVLDDCSGDRTAEIIRSFAQDGVRFVRGLEPAERWLAKNQAYQKLYEEASGDLMLFCGVDVRFGSTTIRNMVNLLHARKKSMISVLPVRVRGTSSVALVQPMRYWWELALPRKLFNRPAVLSTCWLISRDKIRELGGFEAVCHAIIPEGFFARELIKTNEYSFLRSSNELDVSTVKSFTKQRDTTLRMRYPQIRRRPEIALTLFTAELLFLLLPFGLLVAGIWWHFINLWIVATTCALLIITHLIIIGVTDPANSLLAVFNFPLVVITEIILGLTSMVRYEFFKVVWKDRNICIPVMHTIPKLPILDNRR